MALNTRDRISNLPDEIIGHILSFLTTKLAVKTSVLSKRWRYLWTNITDLSFSNVEGRKSFAEFVDRVLRHCVSHQIRRLYLSSNCGVKCDQVRAWINEVTERDVYEVELHLPNVPSCVFNSKNLTVLKLKPSYVYRGHESEFEFPSLFYLPSLRILSIHLCHPPNNLTENLFRSCPALEDLNVTLQGVDDNCNIIISAPLLKKFRLDSTGKLNSKCKFLINAPNLEYLNMNDIFTSDYKVENLSSIAEAKIHVRDSCCAIELFRGVRGVKSLSWRWSLGSFNLFRARNYHGAPQFQLPIFYNLTRLELIDLEPNDREMLPRLLLVSPILKVLILKKWGSSPGTVNPEDASGWIEVQKSPGCLSSFLKLVEIERFEGTLFELKVVEYLLAHATVLNKLTIKDIGVNASEDELKFWRTTLLKFPRRSTACQVYFLGELLSNF